MARDLLVDASWSCCATAPGAASDPDDLEKLAPSWLAAPVPGTAAGAVAAASGRGPALAVDVDTSDWWFRTAVPAGADGRWTLVFDGLATVADIWFRGVLVGHSENMFVPARLELASVAGGDEIVVRCGALTPALTGRRPRPRWKTQMVDHQALRWFRTSYLGRQPGWVVVPPAVGPWRPVRLEPADAPRLVARRVVASCDDHDRGLVSVRLRLAGLPADADRARLRVRGPGIEVDGPLALGVDGDALMVEGEVAVDGVERWWPATHGPQPLYQVTVTVGAATVDVGRVGFRTIVLDRRHGAFSLSVNGVDVFCRGACWWPIEPLAPHAGDDDLRATLALVLEAHMNMVRIPGGTAYEDDRFWDLCDELGIMVWQDCMLSYTDPPQDEAFEAALVTELEHVFGALSGRPALAVVCGGQEIEEQAAMFGLARESWTSSLTETTIPALAADLLPAVAYVTSSPTGGDLPFQPDVGDCHYWGVGSYLRMPDDARRSGLRFMSEGLGLGTPPERLTVDEACGGAARAGHDPGWKQAVHHDTGRSWDLEDVRDFYVQELLGVDPHKLRYLDPERALDLGRAVGAELFSRCFSEWRRPGSPCAGALAVALRDLVPGAGWGLVDALGRPKAPWYALRRALAPVALLVTDEGLNGLHLHLLNDTDAPFHGELTVELFARGEVRVEAVTQVVDIPARGHLVVEAGSLFDGFRDLSYAYRFGPPPYDVVACSLGDEAGQRVSEVVHLPAGLGRPVESDIGLQATARAGDDDRWSLSVTTGRLAQWLVVEVPGFAASDSWFHLAPGATRTVTLSQWSGPAGDGGTACADGPSVPSGSVRALNAQAPARLMVVP